MQTKTVALIGNPNCGKSTLFNLLTGAHQHVGNYPGITVEKHEGKLHIDGEEATLVDLPGTYSLTAYSAEEMAARNFLLEEDITVVVVVLDAANLERSLYLTLQIQEMGKPVIVVLNMMDEVRRKGITIDAERLSAVLHAPVVPMAARKGEGKHLLLEQLRHALRHPPHPAPLRISYGTDLDPVIDSMTACIDKAHFWGPHYAPRWLAVKYLEQDEDILRQGAEAQGLHRELTALVHKVADHTQKTLNTLPDALVADYRYGYISGLLRDIVTRPPITRFGLTDRLDKILTHALIGPVLMLGVLYGLFWLTIELGATPQGWVENFFAWLTDGINALLPEGELRSLLTDGIIAGVGGVLGFAPLILIMYFFLSFLEDSGYLARMAYMLDRVFRLFGLHGASVVPFIIAGGIPGGCAVPGVMASRTLRSPRERIATVLTTPFLSCGAKTPVFLMMAIAFFPKDADVVLFGVTCAGWASVLLIALVLRKTVIAGESTPFVMELPPYRLPTLRGLVTHTWERVWMYVKKAGTVILAISIVVWTVMTYPRLPEERLAAQQAQVAALTEVFAHSEFPSAQARKAALAEARAALDNEHAREALAHSYAGRVGTALEAVSAPTGFDWRTNIALLGGFAAKEVIVSTLGTAYAMGEVSPDEYASVPDAPRAGLAASLAAAPHWHKNTALAFMLFVLLYAPCFVTVAVIGREIGWKWAVFSVCFNTLFAYSVAVIINNVGKLFL